MINIFKNKEKRKDDNSEYFTKIASMLIHAAKIDETYTDIEKEIVTGNIELFTHVSTDSSSFEKLKDKYLQVIMLNLPKILFSGIILGILDIANNV